MQTRAPTPVCSLRQGINEEYQATDRGDLDLAEIKKKAGSV